MIKKLIKSRVTLFGLYSFIITFLLSSNLVCVFGDSYNTNIENKGSNKYKAVRLTPEIYNYARSDMADLTLYDKNNEQVPYFINSFTESEVDTKKTYDMKLINSFIKDEYQYYDYALKNNQNEDVTATSIEIETKNEGFAKKVEIFGGYDNVNWEKVQDDILYNVDGNRKLEIAFNNVKKYTYYRFKIPNNLEKVAFSSVSLKYNKTLQKKEYFINSISPNYSIEEKGNTTVVKVQGLKHLKLSSITLKTDSIFKRKVTFDSSSSKVLYNLDFSNTSYRDLTMPLASHRVNADAAEVIIENNDDKPIKVLGIDARYFADELIFEGSKSSEFTLKFGDSEGQTPKNYDISNYKELILKEGYDVLTVKDIKSEPSKVINKQEYDYRLIFNITISVVAVVMGVVVFLKIRK